LQNVLIVAIGPLVIDESLLTADMLDQVPVLPVQQAGNAVQRHLIETVFNLCVLTNILSNIQN